VIVSHDERLREVADRVLWLEDGRFRPLEALVRDPTCGMLLDPERAAVSVDTSTGTYFFCAQRCPDEFLAVYTPGGYRLEPTEGVGP